jgi:CheY-like chemotaxis protein
MGRTCLIAEPDPFIARLLERFVEEGGLRAVHARVGQDILELVHQAHPSVIILEPELPGRIRGWDIVRALRLDDETCAIPIISCSWLKDGEVAALVGQVQGNLKKPELHYEDFVEALMRAGIDIGSGDGMAGDS